MRRLGGVLLLWALVAGGLSPRKADAAVSTTTFVKSVLTPLDFQTISGAVASFKGVSFTSCTIQILDSSTYAEQVTFAVPLSTCPALLISPVSGQTPAVNPSVGGSTAAFYVSESSVSILNMRIVPTATTAYGVYVSSPYVTLSSVNVIDPGGRFVEAGIAVSSLTTIRYSSVTVAAAHASAYWLQGSTGTVINVSTGSAAGASGSALWLDGGSSNTITTLVAVNTAGVAVYMSSTTNNTISIATVTSNAAGGYAFYVANSTGNVLNRTYAVNLAGTAVLFSTGNFNNTVSLSTFAAKTAGYAGLYVLGGSSNVFANSYFINSAGNGAILSTTSLNTLTRSTFTANAAAAYALFLYNADSNTILTDYAYNALGTAVAFSTNSSFNDVDSSTFAAKTANFFALFLTGASSNSVNGSVLTNTAGFAAYFDNDSDLNTLSFSTASANSAASYALTFDASSTNTVTGIYAYNALGTAVFFTTGAMNNSVSGSTFAAKTAGYAGLISLNNSSNTFTGGVILNTAGTAVILSTTASNTLTKSSFTANSASGYALFLYNAASNTILTDYAYNALGTAVFFSTGAINNTVSGSTFAAKTAGYAGVISINNSSNTFVGSVVLNTAGNAVWLSTTNSNTFESSTFTANAASGYALYLFNSDSNTVDSSYAYNALGTSVYLSTNSFGNSLTQSTFPAKTANFFSLLVTANSSNTFTGILAANSAGGAVYFSTSGLNMIDQSSFTANLASSFALALAYSSTNSVTNSYIANLAGIAALVSTNSVNNLIDASTVAAAVAGYPALFLVNNSSNSVADGVVSNTLGSAAYISSTSLNTIFATTFTANAVGGKSLFLYNADSNTFSGIYAANAAGTSVYVSTNSAGNLFTQSRIYSNAATFPALYLTQAANTVVDNTYVQGSTAMYVSASTGTYVGDSVLVATHTAGSAIELDLGSVGLSVSSSVLSAGSAGAAVYLAAGDGGLFMLSTNTLSGGYGIYVGTPTAAAQLWVTSNTILPALSSVVNTYGIQLNGLSGGATVQNNAIYYRSPGSMGANTSYAFYANTSGASGSVLFNHNLINEPGMITAGAFYGAYLTNSDNVAFKFNDVYSSAPAAMNVFLLRAGEGSTNLIVKDNIFYSSFTAPGAGKSSATLVISDVASRVGFAGNYNDYFSSNAAMGFSWGGTAAEGLSAWKAATAQESVSISSHPLWASVVAGSEDLHQLSFVGRFNPASGLFDFVDSAHSPGIDTGDPAEDATSETTPNGGIVNLGAYGGTAQASKSALVPTSVALPNVWLSSVAASYADVGATGYVVQASTKADFSSVLYSSSGVGAVTTLAPQGLDPNTTYYLRAGATYAGGTIFNDLAVISTPTWARPITLGTSEFLLVQASSVSVAWVALVNGVSSMTCEGYVLQASSDNFGSLALGAPLFSSATLSVLASTLTLTFSDNGVPLNTANTYYFQIASLNWAGAPNYTAVPRLNFQISQSTDSISFGAIDPTVARSTVSTSSMVVVNVGNWPVTLQLAASTATSPSSPWALSTSSGVDTVALKAVWFGGGVAPPATTFSTFLTTTTQISQAAGNYSSSSPPVNAQDGFQVPAGSSVTLWFQFYLPTTSSTRGPETIRASAQAVYP
jgi:hypothetical protein